MRLKARRIDYTNFIIYGAILMLFAVFFILPSVDYIRNTLYKSEYLILIKMLIGIVAMLAIVIKYVKGYKEYITKLDVSEENVNSLKWMLRKANIYAFIKSTLSMTPFLIFVIVEISKFDIDLRIDFMRIYDELTNRSAFEVVLNNNKEIAFFTSLLLTTAIFSSVIMLFIYLIFKISMNKYYKRINRNFNKISKALKNKEAKLEKVLFEEMVIENELKEISYQNERSNNLYAILAFRFSDFWKQVKKSTTPPHFNLVQ
ncbi:hypothetical protein [Spiroplasma monobiae]|uniref:Transmembrane protein n=1 Tax=Spiroplasma monobiae MQ-1 TaxID=1336748 RepID=A0A2K9LUV7_SPISQ|nr:hypothetical protein [Spiroplasma monobiae]AUM62701.1 hypothetical protein SMONO_v1c04520 [Spiroplasma monobiae MQ-1]